MKSYQDDPTFCKVIPLVLKSEGGYVDHPDDPGGPTMHGVAWNYNAGWLAKRGYTKDTMRSLTLDDARQCYYERYWIESEADGITDEGLAYLHLDTAVNCGVGTAKSFLRGLSHNPRYFNGEGDNNEVLFLRLVMEYEIKRFDYYTRCRNRKAFLEGWINRMEFVMARAQELV